MSGEGPVAADPAATDRWIWDSSAAMRNSLQRMLPVATATRRIATRLAIAVHRHLMATRTAKAPVRTIQTIGLERKSSFSTIELYRKPKVISTELAMAALRRLRSTGQRINHRTRAARSERPNGRHRSSSGTMARFEEKRERTG